MPVDGNENGDNTVNDKSAETEAVAQTFLYIGNFLLANLLSVIIVGLQMQAKEVPIAAFLSALAGFLQHHGIYETPYHISKTKQPRVLLDQVLTIAKVKVKDPINNRQVTRPYVDGRNSSWKDIMNG